MKTIQMHPDRNVFDKDREIRAKIDSLFGEGTSEKIFGDHYVFMTAGDLPLWFNFINTVIQEVALQRNAAKQRHKGKNHKKRKNR